VSSEDIVGRITGSSVRLSIGPSVPVVWAPELENKKSALNSPKGGQEYMASQFLGQRVISQANILRVPYWHCALYRFTYLLTYNMLALDRCFF